MKNVTLDVLYQNIMKLRDDMEYLKQVVGEEYELSGWAKKELREARKVPDSELLSQEEVKKRLREK